MMMRPFISTSIHRGGGAVGCPRTVSTVFGSAWQTVETIQGQAPHPKHPTEEDFKESQTTKGTKTTKKERTNS
jgi:hypothetical protein